MKIMDIAYYILLVCKYAVINYRYNIKSFQGCLEIIKIDRYVWSLNKFDEVFCTLWVSRY